MSGLPALAADWRGLLADPTAATHQRGTHHAGLLPGRGARRFPDGAARVACTGHGVCARLLPEQVRLDEWGYPVLQDDHVDGAAAGTAVTMCPARALFTRAVRRG